MSQLRGAASIAAVVAVLAACAPLQADEVHTQQGDRVPAWVKQVWVLCRRAEIRGESLGALAHLIENGIMKVSEPDERGIADRGDFCVVYEVNPNSARMERGTAASWLEGTRLLDDNVEWLNSVYRLPQDVEVRAAECGTVNAFYSPGERAIIMCYELVTHLLDAGYEMYGGDPDAAEDFAYNVLDGVMLHEVGHALVDVYDLPTTGMEEDAVDQFSAMIQSRTYDEHDPTYDVGRIMMLDVSDWWDYESQYGPSRYWDVHSLDEQRFYNIACYAYGSDPVGNADLVGIDYLHPSRAKTCPQEYKQMSSSWDRLLDGYLVE